jgi:hypothetical protein
VTSWHVQKLNLIFFVKSGKLLRNVTDIKSEVGLKLKMGLGETERHGKREKRNKQRQKQKNRKSKQQQQSLDHFLPCKNNS